METGKVEDNEVAMLTNENKGVQKDKIKKDEETLDQPLLIK